MLMHILDEMRNPHCIPSRVKHNVYMRALHSRDAYAYTARLDHRCHPRLVHMTYHSRDRIVPCVRNSSRFACSYYSLDSCICQL